MPKIGQPEVVYANLCKMADKAGEIHTHESYKVAQYVTLALNPYLEWPDKLKYFRHALQRHCVPPQYPSEEVWQFYHARADLVREHAGTEALRLLSNEDELSARRIAL